MIQRVFATLFLVFFLAACQKTAPNPALINAKASYFAAEVVVTKAAGFHTGLKTLNKEDPVALAEKFSRETQAKLAADMNAHMRGPKPAKVTILLQSVSVASSAGRTLLASDSYVNGTVTITDQATNSVVAAHNIQAQDKAVRGSGNIGIIVAVVANAATSSEEKRIARLRDAFVKKVQQWLSSS